MSRSLYYVGGLAAMLFVVFAAYVGGPQAPQATAAASHATATADPAAVAIDDLAAWPAAAGR
jgi:hypothetical protein